MDLIKPIDFIKNGTVRSNQTTLAIRWGPHHASYRSKDSSYVNLSRSWGQSRVRPKSIDPNEKASWIFDAPDALTKLPKDTGWFGIWPKHREKIVWACLQIWWLLSPDIARVSQHEISTLMSWIKIGRLRYVAGECVVTAPEWEGSHTALHKTPCIIHSVSATSERRLFSQLTIHSRSNKSVACTPYFFQKR